MKNRDGIFLDCSWRLTNHATVICLFLPHQSKEPSERLANYVFRHCIVRKYLEMNGNLSKCIRNHVTYVCMSVIASLKY